MTPTHSIPRRAFGLLVASVAATLATPTPTIAAAYPDRPITIVSPFTPGGAADGLARLLATKLEANLKTTVLVDNKPGAGTAIGAQFVARSKPDGYTLMLSASSTFSLNPAIMPKLIYNPVKDFESLGMMGNVPIALFANPNLPAKTMPELVTLLKANPEKYSFGSFGNGTTTHFGGEMLNAAIGSRMQHIPYRGSSPAMSDLMGGQIMLSFDTVVAGSPHVKAGKLRALAVLGDRRSSQFPEVPTTTEVGLPEVKVVSWIALVGPRGLPAGVRTRLEKSMATIMADPDMLERMEKMGYEVSYRPMPDWVKFVSDDIERMRQIAEKSKITAE